jgi:GNAT superfamily N-acetyltransferase
MIRRATPADRDTVESIVNEAYAVYIDRIGRPPGPMLDDYGVLIDAGVVHVLELDDQWIAAIIVLLKKADHLLLDNIAVRRDRQGQGLGRQLIAFAEDEGEHRALHAARISSKRGAVAMTATTASSWRSASAEHTTFSIIYIMRQMAFAIEAGSHQRYARHHPSPLSQQSSSGTSAWR